MKRDLLFSKPWMNAAGMLGFAPGSVSNPHWESFGAFVTNPISLRPRLPAAHPEQRDFPGGILLHTGLPNPGFTAVVEKYSARWERLQLPVIVHLMADRPEETQRMLQSLERLDNILAVELGFAPLLADDLIALTLERCVGELPLIFSLPETQILSLGPRLIQNGAATLSLAAPRGSLGSDHQSFIDQKRPERVLSGRLYGPALFPRALETIVQAARLSLPLIGAGGVCTPELAGQMLSAGAIAVQVDTVLWNP